MRTGYRVALAQLAQGRGYQELNKHRGALRGTPGSRVHLQEVHTDYNYTRHNFTGYFLLPRTRALIEARTAMVLVEPTLQLKQEPPRCPSVTPRTSKSGVSSGTPFSGSLAREASSIGTPV